MHTILLSVFQYIHVLFKFIFSISDHAPEPEYKEPEPTYHEPEYKAPEPTYKEPEPTYEEPKEPKYHAPTTKPVIYHGFKPVETSSYHAPPKPYAPKPAPPTYKPTPVYHKKPAQRPRRPSILGNILKIFG